MLMIDETMTLGDFLNLIRPRPWPSDYDPVEFRIILADILNEAAEWCDTFDHRVDENALDLTRTVITGTQMDEARAASIVNGMAELAYYTLGVAEGLTPETYARLEAVKNAHPAFAEPPSATGEAR
jgi:hypothetical protein